MDFEAVAPCQARIHQAVRAQADLQRERVAVQVVIAQRQLMPLCHHGLLAGPEKLVKALAEILNVSHKQAVMRVALHMSSYQLL